MRHNLLSAQGVATCNRVIVQAYDAGQTFDDIPNKKFFDTLLASDTAADNNNSSYTFAKSWARSLVKHKRSGINTNLIRCMNILDVNGDKSAVRKLMTIPNISYSQEVAVALVELGYFTEAKKQCEAIWSNDFLDSYHKPKFSKVLESKLPEFIKRFRNEGDKFFVEVYFSSMPNVSGDDTIESTSESRMRTLAERFSADEILSERKRQVALILLAKTFPKSKAFEKSLTKEVDDLPIELLFSNKDPGFKAKLFGAHFSTQIQLENFEPVHAAWQQINDRLATMNSDNLPWRTKSNLDVISKMTDESLYRLLRNQTPDQLAKNLPMLRKLNQPAYRRPLNPMVAQVAQLMAGKLDEFTQFRQAQDDYLKANGKKVSKVPSMNEFLDHLNTQRKKIKATNPDAVKNFLAGAWQYGTDQGLSFGSKEFVAGTIDPSKTRNAIFGLERIRQIQMAGQKKLLKYGSELATINSVNGEIWLQLARMQVGAGKDADAAESFEKSIEEATDDMVKAKANRRVEYANTLVKLKRNEEARALIKDVASDELFDANKAILKTLEILLKEK